MSERWPDTPPRSGIPTYYKSRLYRSRLEARWAVFFELIKWDAHYEPFDLDGYIPDFIVNTHDEPILFEVRPVTGPDDPLFDATIRKISASGWDREAVIVSYFLPRSHCCDELSVGWLCDMANYQRYLHMSRCAAPIAENFDDRGCVGPHCLLFDKGAWAAAPFRDVKDKSRALFGFCHEYNSYCDRISGRYDGGHYRPPDEEFVLDLWARAGTQAQWHAPVVGDPGRLPASVGVW